MSETPLFHAVVTVDHHQAQVLQFDAEHLRSQKVRSHAHVTRQHGGAVRAEHEFYAEVCAALAGIPEVLVCGSRQAMADFRHYVEKHRAALSPHLVGWETVDHPSEGQLLAFARQYFLKYDRMAGTPTPT